MGTRADFYVGRGSKAEWLGSIGWDGYSVPETVADAVAEAPYRVAVAKFLATRKDARLPAQGWPWPWKNSMLTDFAYAFDDGAVFRTEYPPDEEARNVECVWVRRTDGDWEATKPPYVKCGNGHTCDRNVLDFPDMSAIKNVTLGPESGLIVLLVPQHQNRGTAIGADKPQLCDSSDPVKNKT